ncbi:MAG: hypothetical protein E7214_10895 [Clostridium sp.]|nr:hypothetical protein [Clostridium sp.]
MTLDNPELINYSNSNHNTRQPFPIPFVPIPYGPVFVPPIFGFTPPIGYPPPPPPRPPYRDITDNSKLENYTLCYIPVLLNSNEILK